MWVNRLSDIRCVSRIGICHLFFSIAKFLPPSELKNTIYRMFGVKIGRGVWISPDVVIDPVFPERIHIGDGVFIGWGARLFSHMVDHNRNLHVGDIFIGDNAFIGGFTTIRPGVKVGGGAVVGSDSLVIRDVPPNCKAVGVPAKIVE